jgi:hypothetical protein
LDTSVSAEERGPEAFALLDNEQREMEMYKKYYKWCGSVFFVMEKM